MEVSIHELPECRLVILRLRGAVDRQAVLAYAGLFQECCTARGGFSRLLDLRAVTDIDLDFATLMEVARKKNAVLDPGGSEVAYCIWVEGDVSYGFARMFQNLLEASGAPLRIAIAETADEAAAFLGVKPDIILTSKNAELLSFT